jgi:hypothetical protein
MKKAILILALAVTAHLAQAQKVPMSSKGYWVIESNKHTPKQSTVNFYNLNSELVYQETITGKKVKVDNNHTRKALNNTLELVLEGKKPIEPILAMALSK